MKRNENDLEERLLALQDENKRLHQELAKSKAENARLRSSYQEDFYQLEAIFNLSNDAICIFDAQGYFVKLNPAWTRLLGYSIEELIKKPFTNYIHPEDLEHTFEEGRKVNEEEYTTIQFENRYIKKSGEIVWLSWNAVSNKGNIYAIARDITQEKNDQRSLEKVIEERTAELKRVNQKLQNFARVVAHDLRAPLVVTNGFLKLVEREITQLPRVKKWLDNAQLSIIDMQNLLTAVLDYSKAGTNSINKAYFDLNEMVETLIQQYLLRDTLKAEAAHLTPVITKDQLPKIYGMAYPIRQVFQNLINNGIKFQPLGQQSIIHISYRSDDDYHYISITDNGIGIEEKYQQQIFEPFKRLHHKSEYLGHGVGLSICKDIVEAHGGQMSLQSSIGEGATFQLSIPKKKQKGKK